MKLKSSERRAIGILASFSVAFLLAWSKRAFEFGAVAFLLMSIVLAMHAGWKIRGERSDSLLTFLRLFIPKFLVGDVLTLYGISLFILFAMTLTAWLPDGLEEGDIVFAVSTLMYTFGLVFLSAWVFGVPRKSTQLPARAKYLVASLSIPNWGDDSVFERAKCEDFLRGAVYEGNRPLNIIPLYVALAYHKDRLEEVFLLVSDRVAGEIERREYIERFFSMTSKCLSLKFVINFGELFPGRGEVVIGEGREVHVHFIRIGSGQDIKEVKNSVSTGLSDLLEREGSEVIFDITSGTAVISVAMILEAIKGDARAEYLLQNCEKEYKTECIELIELTLFDFEDLVREFREYFERLYESP
ncbi:hypothetical protein A3L04_01090 [Thermococcus chitonophagus]|uniref:Uncharacterized protein n=1 Tax=Thermococcus chitonophagus TaxID=54262 RepID=A0A2Z2N2Q5_9EURY|nr:hypothetical protein [Thermococcus chitonophagus]ASJ15764.1 hypothetical protein A3L04_01090 [Thermococcus chitonophagus]